jgi:hypothetical protein
MLQNKPLVLVFAVGDIDYKEHALPVLYDYFKRHSVRFEVVTRAWSDKPAHPSWYKTLAHSMYDEEFIIIWDLDLLPVTQQVKFPPFDYDKFNIAVDTFVVYNPGTANSAFGLNCGLMGIPKQYGLPLANLFELHWHSSVPLFEQPHVNQWINDSKIPISTIPSRYNVLMPMLGQNPRPWLKAELRHYTYGVCADKAELIRRHNVRYFL